MVKSKFLKLKVFINKSTGQGSVLIPKKKFFGKIPEEVFIVRKVKK